MVIVAVISDRCITSGWPQRIAHLHKSMIGRLLSEWIWSSHLLIGWVLTGSLPRERYVDLVPKSLMIRCASCKLQVCHLHDQRGCCVFWWLQIRSMSGGSPLCLVISVFVSQDMLKHEHVIIDYVALLAGRALSVVYAKLANSHNIKSTCLFRILQSHYIHWVTLSFAKTEV